MLSNRPISWIVALTNMSLPVVKITVIYKSGYCKYYYVQRVNKIPLVSQLPYRIQECILKAVSVMQPMNVYKNGSECIQYVWKVGEEN